MSFFGHILSFIFVLGVCCARSEIIVYDEDFEDEIAAYKSMPAHFGKSLPDDGLKGRVVQSYPIDGCHQVQPPPNATHPKDEASKTWVVVIRYALSIKCSSFFIARYHKRWLNISTLQYFSRGGGCNFETKIRAATNANWSAAIVYNNKGNNALVPMAGDDDDAIPSVFMG